MLEATIIESYIDRVRIAYKNKDEPKPENKYFTLILDKCYSSELRYFKVLNHKTYEPTHAYGRINITIINSYRKNNTLSILFSFSPVQTGPAQTYWANDNFNIKFLMNNHKEKIALSLTKSNSYEHNIITQTEYALELLSDLGSINISNLENKKEKENIIEEGFIYKNKNLSGMSCKVLESSIKGGEGVEYAFVEFQEDVDGSSNDGKNTKKNCLFLPQSKIKNIQ